MIATPSPKYLLVLLSLGCMTATAAASCVASLDKLEHQWLQMEVSNIGKTDAGDGPQIIKLKMQHWVITARLPRPANLNVADWVEAKQDKNIVSIKTPTGEVIKCPLICIQSVVYVE